MLEEYFASTGEKAHCLSWCHKRSEALYGNRSTWIDLPVIVISGVTGFLSAGAPTLFDNPRMSSVALGVASLFVSILNTAGSYYGWAKRSEGHRISAIHYARLYRFIAVELSLPREERMTPNDFLKYVKDQYDRLQEVSPLIPPIIIREFQRKFSSEKHISKPEEANGLEKILVYRVDTDLHLAMQNDKRLPVIKERISKIALAVNQMKSTPMWKSQQLRKGPASVLSIMTPGVPSPSRSDDTSLGSSSEDAVDHVAETVTIADAQQPITIAITSQDDEAPSS
jgi:hypothetical protein